MARHWSYRVVGSVFICRVTEPLRSKLVVLLQQPGVGEAL